MISKRTAARLIILTAFASVANAEDAAVTHDRLQRVTQASSLDGIDARPWHAKLALTVFDDSGKNPVEGTIEYSRSGADWLRVVTLGPNSQTQLHHDNHTFSGITGNGVPYIADAALDEFLHAGPSQSEIDASEPELRKQNFGKVSLDCIMLTKKMKMVAFPPLGLFPTYCLLSGSDRLAASYDFGGRTVTINRSGKFLNHDVPMEFSMVEGSVLVAKAKLTSLATFEPAQDTFLPGTQLVPVADTARISSGVMQGQILTKIQPSYPEAAKASHISGTVVLRAIIGRDGHVHLLQVMSAPEPNLAIAALAAVRKWTYKPYLLNGEAVDVDTTVIVNFNLRPY